MKQTLVKSVRKVLPSGAVNVIEGAYRSGRVKVAATRYRNPSKGLKVIVVVGESGKTTTAAYLQALLTATGKTITVLSDQTRLTSHYDQSVSAFYRELQVARQAKADYVILEVSDRLYSLGVMDHIEPYMVIATNYSKQAAALIAKNVQYVVVSDNLDLTKLAIADYQIISFGHEDSADVKIDDIVLYRKGTEVSLVIDHQTTIAAATQLVGYANAYNVTAAVSAFYILGGDINVIPDAIADVEPLAGNYQYLAGAQPYDAIIDTATSESSVDLVLRSARKLSRRRLIVVASNVSDTELAAIRGVADRVVIIGAHEIVGIDNVETVDQAVMTGFRIAKQDDSVLLIGRDLLQKDIQGQDTASKVLQEL